MYARITSLCLCVHCSCFRGCDPLVGVRVDGVSEEEERSQEGQSGILMLRCLSLSMSVFILCVRVHVICVRVRVRVGV